MSDLEEEIWRPIPGFSGYEVSSLGHVCSFWKHEKDYLTNHRWSISDKPQRMLVGGYSSRDRRYIAVCLARDGKQVSKYIHDLVLLAFVGPKPAGFEVCHNDDNPENNCLVNLRYDTHRANVQDAMRNGKWTVPLHENTKNSFTVEQIIEIREHKCYMNATFRELAKRYGASPDTISSICRGKSYKDFPGPILTERIRFYSKLSNADVDSIRAMKKQGLSHSKVARLFGVDQSMISRIVNGSRRSRTSEGEQ